MYTLFPADQQRISVHTFSPLSSHNRGKWISLHFCTAHIFQSAQTSQKNGLLSDSAHAHFSGTSYMLSHRFHFQHRNFLHPLKIL